MATAPPTPITVTATRAVRLLLIIKWMDMIGNHFRNHYFDSIFTEKIRKSCINRHRKENGFGQERLPSASLLFDMLKKDYSQTF